MFTLNVRVWKSICNRIVCVCHLIIKDYLLTYLLILYISFILQDMQPTANIKSNPQQSA